jgi:DnaJ-class molecular chaperone
MGVNKDGRQGDQFVTVNVAIPTDLTPEDRKLFEQLDENRKTK